MKEPRVYCLILLTSLYLVGVARSEVMLSSELDTRRSTPTKAVRNSMETTSFWGMSGVLGGIKKC